MPAHSRSQNGVALLAYVASLHVLRRRTKSWMAGTSPAITAREFCAGKRENISSSTRRRIVAVLVTYRFKSRLIGRGPDACRVAGRGRCPRTDLQPAPGRLWASTQHYDRGARCQACSRRSHRRFACCPSAWTTGSKSGGDESEKALAIARVLKNASRERLVIARVRETIQAEMSRWIASSLPLLAMTKTHREKDIPMRKTKTAKLSSELKHAARFEAEKA